MATAVKPNETKRRCGRPPGRKVVVRLAVYLPIPVARWLKEYAESEGRSTTAQAVRILEAEQERCSRKR